jgi:hypothetical protein
MGIRKQLDPILEPLMAAVRRAERFLGPDDDWVEADRRILFEAAQRRFGHLHKFVYEKGPDDYICTANATPDVVEQAISPYYQRNLASSRKCRTHHNGEKQWAVGSWVHDPPSEPWQHHIYLFETENGRTDIYGHRETSVREGIEHITETDQKHGDPQHRLRDQLDRAGIGYGTRQF